MHLTSLHPPTADFVGFQQIAKYNVSSSTTGFLFLAEGDVKLR